MYRFMISCIFCISMDFDLMFLGSPKNGGSDQCHVSLAKAFPNGEKSVELHPFQQVQLINDHSSFGELDFLFQLCKSVDNFILGGSSGLLQFGPDPSNWERQIGRS